MRQSTPLTPNPTIVSANERIKGMFSRRDSGMVAAVDKALPTPTPTLPPNPSNGAAIGGIIGNRDSFLGTPSRPSTPRVEQPTLGFKQVATPMSPDPRRPQSPLPALPITPDIQVTEAPPGSQDSATDVTPVDRPARKSSLVGNISDIDGRNGEPAQSPRLDSPSPGSDT